MASTGAGRGVIYTRNDYGSFRLIFTMRHVSGQPDHQACVLIFCSRPSEGEKGLDALGGIQFQVPNGISPANEVIVYAVGDVTTGAGGADYYVDNGLVVEVTP